MSVTIKIIPPWWDGKSVPLVMSGLLVRHNAARLGGVLILAHSINNDQLRKVSYSSFDEISSMVEIESTSRQTLHDGETNTMLLRVRSIREFIPQWCLRPLASWTKSAINLLLNT